MPELDRTLLLGIERGERAALDALARQFAAPVYRYLVRLSGNATLAEDLAQEVAVQMWRALPGRRFPNERALTAWIYTVATNAYRMHRRKKRPDEVQWEMELDLAADDSEDPACAAEREELAGQVRRAVATLPERERQALLMKAFGDLRYEEISEATGEPVGTVKWRISRAYARLRQVLLPPAGACVEPASAPAGAARPGRGATSAAGRVERNDESLQSAPAVPGRRDGTARAVAHGEPRAAVSGLFGTDGR